MVRGVTQPLDLVVQLDGAPVFGQLLGQHDRQPPDRQPQVGLPHRPGRIARAGVGRQALQADTHAPAAEQEPAQVLVSLLGIDLAVAPGVGPVHVGPVRFPDVGVIDVDQAVGLRARRSFSRQPVILRVGADRQKTSSVGRSRRASAADPMPAGRHDHRNSCRVEISMHVLGGENLRARLARRFPRPMSSASDKGDAAVRGAVGEKPADQIPGRPMRPSASAESRSSESCSGRQAAHGVGHQYTFGRPGLARISMIRSYSPAAAVLDVEPVAGDLLAQPAEQPLGQVLVRWCMERGRGLIVEPVDPQGRGISYPRPGCPGAGPGCRSRRPCIAHRRSAGSAVLRIGRNRVAVSGDPDVRGPVVEAVKGIVNLCINSGRRTGISSNVYDWQPVHATLPARFP